MAVVARLFAPKVGVLRAARLYFVGHGPWLLFAVVISGICIFAPDVYATRTAMLVLLGVTFLWGGALTWAFMRAGLALGRAKAALATLLFYFLYVGAIVLYFHLSDQIPARVLLQRPVKHLAFRLAFWASALLFFVGLGVGTLTDPVPVRKVEYRAGYRVLEVDFHAHTRFSDGFLSPFDLVIQAKRRGLDALAVTEHNNVWPAKEARWFGARWNGPTILVGEEITTKKFHVHGIGIERKVDPNQPLAKILDDVHAQGGITIAAHPWTRFHAVLEPVRDRLDGAEVMHPTAHTYDTGSLRWEGMRDFYLKARDEGFPIAAIGSSDYHMFSVLGIDRTLVFAERNDEASILAAVRAGRTVVYDLEGKPYGNLDLIEELRQHPYEMRPQDYDYHGENVLDRVARTLGWLGLLGIVLFRPRLRRAPG